MIHNDLVISGYVNSYEKKPKYYHYRRIDDIHRSLKSPLSFIFLSLISSTFDVSCEQSTSWRNLPAINHGESIQQHQDQVSYQVSNNNRPAFNTSSRTDWLNLRNFGQRISRTQPQTSNDNFVTISPSDSNMRSGRQIDEIQNDSGQNKYINWTWPSYKTVKHHYNDNMGNNNQRSFSDISSSQVYDEPRQHKERALSIGIEFIRPNQNRPDTSNQNQYENQATLVSSQTDHSYDLPYKRLIPVAEPRRSSSTSSSFDIRPASGAVGRKHDQIVTRIVRQPEWQATDLSYVIHMGKDQARNLKKDKIDTTKVARKGTTRSGDKLIDEEKHGSWKKGSEGLSEEKNEKKNKWKGADDWAKDIAHDKHGWKNLYHREEFAEHRKFHDLMLDKNSKKGNSAGGSEIESESGQAHKNIESGDHYDKDKHGSKYDYQAGSDWRRFNSNDAVVEPSKSGQQVEIDDQDSNKWIVDHSSSKSNQRDDIKSPKLLDIEKTTSASGRIDRKEPKTVKKQLGKVKETNEFDGSQIEPTSSSNEDSGDYNGSDGSDNSEDQNVAEHEIEHMKDKLESMSGAGGRGSVIGQSSHWPADHGEKVPSDNSARFRIIIEQQLQKDKSTGDSSKGTSTSKPAKSINDILRSARQKDNVTDDDEHNHISSSSSQSLQKQEISPGKSEMDEDSDTGEGEGDDEEEPDEPPHPDVKLVNFTQLMIGGHGSRKIIAPNSTWKKDHSSLKTTPTSSTSSSTTSTTRKPYTSIQSNADNNRQKSINQLLETSKKRLPAASVNIRIPNSDQQQVDITKIIRLVPKHTLKNSTMYTNSTSTRYYNSRGNRSAKETIRSTSNGLNQSRPMILRDHQKSMNTNDVQPRAKDYNSEYYAKVFDSRPQSSKSNITPGALTDIDESTYSQHLTSNSVRNNLLYDSSVAQAPIAVYHPIHSKQTLSNSWPGYGKTNKQAENSFRGSGAGGASDLAIYESAPSNYHHQNHGPILPYNNLYHTYSQHPYHQYHPHSHETSPNIFSGLFASSSSDHPSHQSPPPLLATLNEHIRYAMAKRPRFLTSATSAATSTASTHQQPTHTIYSLFPSRAAYNRMIASLLRATNTQLSNPQSIHYLQSPSVSNNIYSHPYGYTPNYLYEPLDSEASSPSIGLVRNFLRGPFYNSASSNYPIIKTPSIQTGSRAYPHFHSTFDNNELMEFGASAASPMVEYSSESKPWDNNNYRQQDKFRPTNVGSGLDNGITRYNVPSRDYYQGVAIPVEIYDNSEHNYVFPKQTQHRTNTDRRLNSNPNGDAMIQNPIIRKSVQKLIKEAWKKPDILNISSKSNNITTTAPVVKEGLRQTMFKKAKNVTRNLVIGNKNNN